MALKPGRVGVSPSQVDLFGNLIGGGSGGGYTKAEADAKFLAQTDAASTYLTQSSASSTYETKTNVAATYETKTNAANTYETKSNAAATYETKTNAAATYATKSDVTDLQPKTLAVPISMLNGSFSTVEGGFAGDVGALTNKEITDRLDLWSSSSTVQSDNTVTFTGLNNDYGYDLYCQDKLIGISSILKTGSGSNVTLVYTVTGATAGDTCKLRIIR